MAVRAFTPILIILTWRTAALIFNGFLNDLLKLTDSEYGFIGEILHTKEQQPYTRMFAVSDISSVCFTYTLLRLRLAMV